MGKMDWLVEKYNNGKCDYLISKTNDAIGNIIMPTGTGKSGVSFEDAIWHIDNRNKGKKLVINFSAPILKLLRQSVSDFNGTLSQTHTELIENGKIMFFINSSDADEGYSSTENGIDAFRFSEDIDKFYKSKNAEIAIVASCHKSMDKFVAKMPTMRKYATIVTYLDESHLFNTTKTTHSHGGKDYEENPCFVDLCKNSDYLYGLTATPDREVTERINEFNGHNGDCAYFSYKIDARDVIEQNVILPPRIATMKLSEDEVLSADLLIYYKNQLKKTHPNIIQKILVTCKNSKELGILEKSLAKMGEKVFSTCSAKGCHNAEGEIATEIDEVRFMEEVDNYDERDCFVLHIRQLIQGIDIKSITSAVICTASHTDDTTNRKHIQIIGRALRPAMGERGMDIEHRTKKCGDVLFVMPNTFDGEKSIINFVEKYYGIGYIVGDYRKLNEPHHIPSKEETIEDTDDPSNFGISFPEYEKTHSCNLLLIGIENYVREKLAPRHRFLIKNGGKGINIDKEIETITNNCGAFNEDYDSMILLSRTNLQRAIKNLFDQYEISL